MTDFIRRVVDFHASYGQTAFWSLKLECGHRAKLPMMDGGSPMDRAMPHLDRVRCRACAFRARALGVKPKKS